MNSVAENSWNTLNHITHTHIYEKSIKYVWVFMLRSLSEKSLVCRRLIEKSLKIVNGTFPKWTDRHCSTALKTIKSVWTENQQMVRVCVCVRASAFDWCHVAAAWASSYIHICIKLCVYLFVNKQAYGTQLHL